MHSLASAAPAARPSRKLELRYFPAGREVSEDDFPAELARQGGGACGELAARPPPRPLQEGQQRQEPLGGTGDAAVLARVLGRILTSTGARLSTPVDVPPRWEEPRTARQGRRRDGAAAVPDERRVPRGRGRGGGPRSRSARPIGVAHRA